MAGGHPPTAAAGLSLATVLRAALHVERPSLPPHHWRILNALLVCRTPALGGHRYACEDCGKTHFVPHSCRNRHCPLCQGQAAHRWLEQQEATLLPVPYFHLVFTLPHVLNPLIRQNQRALYRLLFQAASQTLLEFGRRRWGAQLGITAVLHTWSQTLLDHLSRYTHRVAISPRRLLALDAEHQTVSFAWKDYADQARRKTMTLGLGEFVRRFCLHLLPERFVKIRHFGFLSPRQRRKSVAQARALLGSGIPEPTPTPSSIAGPPTSPAAAPESEPGRTCPHCGSGRLILIEIVNPERGSPAVPCDSS